MEQINWTNAVIANLNHLAVGDSFIVGNSIIECRDGSEGVHKCSGCALVGSGRCNDINCFKPNRKYLQHPLKTTNKYNGYCSDEATDIIDRMNISYKRERLAFLSLIFTIGALGAIIMLTIIDLIRYAVTFGVK